MPRLTAALSGSLEKLLADEVRAAETAVTAGLKRATDGLKSDLRQQVIGAGLGQGLARSWRGEVFPKGRRSLDAAGLVYTRSGRILRGFAEGVTIRSRDGLWLAIPSENAPRRGIGGKRISPSTFPEHRYGRLRFVFRPGKPGLLVVDGLRTGTGRRGGFRRASQRALRTGRGLVTVVMFVLVPQVQLRKRLDVDGPARRWQGQLPQLVLEAWPQVQGSDR
jgi:hypothetical protein